MTYFVQGPETARAPQGFESWCRIHELDGSTVAYVPDQATAARIARLLQTDEYARSSGEEP